MKVAQKTTYTDLQSWPDDGRRYELYDGEAWVIPSPLLMHYELQLRAGAGQRMHSIVLPELEFDVDPVFAA